MVVILQYLMRVLPQTMGFMQVQLVRQPIGQVTSWELPTQRLVLRLPTENLNRKFMSLRML